MHKKNYIASNDVIAIHATNEHKFANSLAQKKKNTCTFSSIHQ